MRLTWIATALILASTTAQANTGLEQQLSICAVKSDKLDRLICYDALAEKVQQANQNGHAVAVTLPAVAVQSTAATPTVATPAVAPTPVVNNTTPVVSNTAQDPAAAFGLQKTIEEEVGKLYFEVAEVSKDPYGAFIITLNNGQVWKQTESDRFKINKGQTIYIEKGALSSFLLGTDDRNSTTRVKRLK
ncbi:hypothetical protein [Shewanella subflava]|uniref:Uncharacterized protein n=1 Tax=Shewanella subflava TaxID=2986476 RepID=A0ABT3I9V2_9GAMM|nr:hypothetical protein [Shewanella subflava]MCW3172836.1 hypothetical protein [Shewanella subflava]